MHHRASHRGELLIEGSSSGIRFRHADGRAYGESVEPRSIDVYTKTFGALRSLGFREGEIRAALAKLRSESEPPPPSNCSVQRWPASRDPARAPRAALPRFCAHPALFTV